MAYKIRDADQRESAPCLNQTENQSSDIAGAGYQATQSINAVLYNRPYRNTLEFPTNIVDDRGNNRYKTSTSKERKCIRKLDPVKIDYEVLRLQDRQ